MLWIALVLFAIWVLGLLGDIGNGAHTLLIDVICVLIVGLTGRAARRLADEAERRTHA